MANKITYHKTEITTPNKPPVERPRSLVYDRIDEPHYVKLIPLAALIVIVVGIFAIIYVGVQSSIEGYKAVTAQAEAIEKQAEAIERQTALIEGMVERRKARMPNSKEIKDLMVLFGAIVLSLYAINLLFK